MFDNDSVGIVAEGIGASSVGEDNKKCPTDTIVHDVTMLLHDILNSVERATQLSVKVGNCCVNIILRDDVTISELINQLSSKLNINCNDFFVKINGKFATSYDQGLNCTDNIEVLIKGKGGSPTHGDKNSRKRKSSSDVQQFLE